ncbi:MAG: hypothetical protein WBN92_06460 [Terriglobia bacterium]
MSKNVIQPQRTLIKGRRLHEDLPSDCKGGMGMFELDFNLEGIYEKPEKHWIQVPDSGPEAR